MELVILAIIDLFSVRILRSLEGIKPRCDGDKKWLGYTHTHIFGISTSPSGWPMSFT